MPGIDPERRDALPAGSALREYTLESVIGHGGFGIVYRAQHDELGGTVAIKEYLPIELAVREGANVRVRSAADSRTFEDGLKRFRGEARALMQCQDLPGVVSCRDFFRANGTAYMVMEFEDGRPLSEVLKTREAAGRPFSQADLLGVMVPLLEGLENVHEAGLLHRDIKPSNILIRRVDGRPVLVDFGASKQVVANQSKSMAPFTEGYAALEQVAAAGELGPWTDMYGVGAVMWRMVAGGQPPWQPPHPLRVETRSHALVGDTEDPLPSAAKLGEGRFSRRVLEAIDACLRLQEKRRIQSCRELLGMLRSKRNDPEDFPFGPRVRLLNKFARALIRVVFRAASWMPRPRYLDYEMLADAITGDPSAQLGLARVHILGLGGKQDYAGAAAWYRKAAEQGHAAAQHELGRLYGCGLGVKQDHAEAASWFEEAAEQGDEHAQCDLGALYFLGRGVVQDYARAAKWYGKAARQGHSEAQCWIACLHYIGQGVEQDYAVAAEWCRKAAEQGHPAAQDWLGQLYARGHGVDQDYAVARVWRNRASEQGDGVEAEWYREAAEQGHAEAQYWLGCHYEHGWEVAQDHAAAEEWYRKAAEQGHAKAQYWLGDLYESGRGVAQDYAVAVMWYAKAAEQGDRESQYWLGFLYAVGQKVAQDLAAAAKWCGKAAEQGDKDAQYLLAGLYHSGHGVAQDHGLAAEWYRKAAEQGHAEAQSRLAYLYDSGDGVEQDPAVAAECYRKAAEQGDRESQYLLGAACYCGRGVAQDLAAAAKWYRKAAEQGHAEAQSQLGRLYETGQGVKPDYVIATREFVPEDYLEVQVDFDARHGRVYRGTYYKIESGKRKSRLPLDGKEAAVIVERARHGRADIESVKKSANRMPPPFLYDLVELQRHANHLYGFSARRTLELAQTLYEKHKAITCPRTDSRHLSSAVESELPRIAANVAANYNERLVAEDTGDRMLGKRYIDDFRVTDRHAIIPTGASGVAQDTPEGRILDLVNRRLLQAWHADYKYFSTTVITRICYRENADQFLSTGTAVDDIGWKILDLKTEKNKGKASEEPKLPGGLVQCQSVKVLQAEPVKK